MAQLVLTLAGGVLGGGIGGGLGQSLGALFGAYVGGIVDQQLFGPQQDRKAVEGARVTDVSLSGSAYGQTIPTIWGRMRVPANIVWLRGIREVVRTETETVGGGGKGGGGGSAAQTITRTTYHYYADVALGICEGPVTSIYRIWLDKTPIDPEHVDEIRLYYGDESQGPDPLIQAVEGSDKTSALRGLAYVVLENLYLTPYGNHFPNFEIEVYRGSRPEVADARHLVRSVCVIPASGEWAYEPTIVRSRVRNANINSNAGRKASDFAVSIEGLKREVPNVEWVSLVYAWFGTSLDVGTCSIRPEAEYSIYPDRLPDTAPYTWSVMGMGRPVVGGGGPAWPLVSFFTKPDGSMGIYYGGTISDGSIVRAIEHLHSLGYKVALYPFLMIDIPPPDPSPFPWRGRIGGASANVAGFFERPDGYLRFVRHGMSLAEDAGGVDGFVIGSEMVALNRIRDGAGAYPAVSYWQTIASEAKTRLGTDCVVTYAADWSEYRYNDRGGANVDFPLDALWADANIDVVGIDAYFPLTDVPRAIYDKATIAAGWNSGELIDYFYATQADRDLERRGFDPQRSAIDDRFYAIKDIRFWWENEHVPRVGGTPIRPPTAWVPRSKPIWFTEYGVPSVNCATNQPNVFIDTKSSESFAPYYSNRAVDRVVQRAAIEATEEFWSDPANNPVSPLNGRAMVERRFVWCWDARPYPFFPALTNVWSDGENFRLGHWIEGKIGNMLLSEIVRDLCLRAGLTEDDFDVSALDDEVVGYVVTERKPIRDMIGVLQTAYFFDAFESDGKLVFVKRGAGTPIVIDANDLGASENDGDRSRIKIERTQDTELPIAIDIVHLDEARDYQSSTATLAWNGSAWVDALSAVSAIQNLALLGIRTTADTSNRLAVKSNGVLFSHDDVTPGTGDIRATLNKSAAGKDGGFTFQDAFSTRALFGLLGDDDFSVKVSPDGSTFYLGISIDKDTGHIGLGGAVADALNTLIVKGTAFLFDRETDDVRFTFNKAAAGDDVALTFQTNYSARALVGLLGDDDFTFKVSPDGSTYYTGFVLDKDNGQFKIPIAPKFSAYTNFDNYIAANTWTKIQFNNADSNDQSVFSGGSNNFTAPFAGPYALGFSLRFKANATVPTKVIATFYKNGAELGRGRAISGAPTDDVTTYNLTVLIPLAANDVIDVRVNFATNDGYIESDHSHFWGHYVP